MNDIIMKNWIVDLLKKEEVDPIEKANLVREFMDKNGYTQRSLASEMGCSKSKIHNLLLWNRVDDEKYEGLKKKGYTKTDVMRLLRDGDNVIKRKRNEYDIYLKHVNIKVKQFIKNESINAVTETLVKDLINSLNRSLINKKIIG